MFLNLLNHDIKIEYEELPQWRIDVIGRGEKDFGIVPELLKDKEISVFYCSPYRRSLDTIRLCAEQYHMEIHEP